VHAELDISINHNTAMTAQIAVSVAIGVMQTEGGRRKGKLGGHFRSTSSLVSYLLFVILSVGCWVLGFPFWVPEVIVRCFPGLSFPSCSLVLCISYIRLCYAVGVLGVVQASGRERGSFT